MSLLCPARALKYVKSYIYMVSFAAMHWFNSFAGSRPPGTPALPEDIVRGSARAPGSRWARGHWEGGGAGNYMNPQHILQKLRHIVP